VRPPVTAPGAVAVPVRGLAGTPPLGGMAVTPAAVAEPATAALPAGGELGFLGHPASSSAVPSSDPPFHCKGSELGSE
jgi:hypothetical protein